MSEWSADERVLVLAPSSKDAELARELLERAGVWAEPCDDVDDLCARLEKGAAAILVVEEAILGDPRGKLVSWLVRQPPWSDLPILVLARPGADSTSVAHAMDQLGNVTVLERPTRLAALVSAVRSAVRARRRQYQTREFLIERERAADTLRRSQERLEMVLSGIADQFIVLERDWRCSYTNDRVSIVTGKSRQQLLGRVVWDVLPELAGAGFERAARESMAKQEAARAEFYYPSLRRWFENHFYPAHDRLTVLITETTERRQAESALRESAQQLQLVTDAMPGLISYIDADLIYRFVNRQYELWFGHDRADVLHKPVEEVLGEAAMIRLRPEMDRALAGEDRRFEAQIPYRDGGTRWVDARYVPHRDDHGRVVGFFVLVIDISARKRAEAEMERSNRAEREALEALRRADRRKDEFIAVLAHELRNPLAPIRSSLDVLRLRAHDAAISEEAIAIVERQVGHMVRLVDDLLEISRISRGAIELRRQRVDVAAAVRSAVETSRPWIDRARQKLELTLPGQALLLDADPVRLTQVIANLLNNASKYSEIGATIELEVGREGDAVRISVRDSGAGIPAEMLPRVFDIFVSAAYEPGRAHDGLGIGLTLVKSLVELHGGSVSAASGGKGLGSEFVVRLPLAHGRSTVARTPEAGSGPDLALGPRRILVVVDNRDAAESLATLLRMLGAEVEVAYSGAEALKAVALRRPDAILMDIGMPGMDGHEAARRIREQAELKDVVMIALTGWGQEEDRRRARETGFDHHLTKPADLHELQSLLESVRARPELAGAT